MKRQYLIFGAVLLGLLVAPATQAAIQLDGWTIDLSKTGQGLQGSFSGVSGITQAGLFHNTLYSGTTIKTTAPAVGDYYVTDGLLRATGFTGAASTTVSAVPAGGTPAVLNGPSPAGAGTTSFEMTVAFSIATQITSIASLPGGLNISTSPITSSPISGNYLYVYIDNLNNGVGSTSDWNMTPGGGTGGSGFQDGTRVARFKLSTASGDGESLNTAALTGDLRSTFTLLSGTPFVFYDKSGRDISYLPGVIRLTMDSALNMDPDQNGLADSGSPQNWPFANKSVQPFASFFGTDPDDLPDPVATPEPATLLIWCGLFALLLPFLLRRKGQKPQ